VPPLSQNKRRHHDNSFSSHCNCVWSPFSFHLGSLNSIARMISPPWLYGGLVAAGALFALDLVILVPLVRTHLKKGANAEPPCDLAQDSPPKEITAYIPPTFIPPPTNEQQGKSETTPENSEENKEEVKTPNQQPLPPQQQTFPSQQPSPSQQQTFPSQQPSPSQQQTFPSQQQPSLFQQPSLPQPEVVSSPIVTNNAVVDQPPQQIVIPLVTPLEDRNVLDIKLDEMIERNRRNLPLFTRDNLYVLRWCEIDSQNIHLIIYSQTVNGERKYLHKSFTSNQERANYLNSPEGKIYIDAYEGEDKPGQFKEAYVNSILAEEHKQEIVDAQSTLEKTKQKGYTIFDILTDKQENIFALVYNDTIFLGFGTTSHAIYFDTTAGRDASIESLKKADYKLIETKEEEKAPSNPPPNSPVDVGQISEATIQVGPAGDVGASDAVKPVDHPPAGNVGSSSNSVQEAEQNPSNSVGTDPNKNEVQAKDKEKNWRENITEAPKKISGFFRNLLNRKS
jgi:hypothetical protein